MELKKQAINLVGDFMVDWYIARNTSNFNFLYLIEIDCFFLPGSKLGSTGELGRMESPGSKRRYREENYRCK